SSLNVQSQAAIVRLGAKLDGVLRSHQIVKDDILRDTHVYSILKHEWPLFINGFTKGDWAEAFLFALSVAVSLT
ncbi:hypothetical protein RFX26_16245, partial [Acinetobacter baumannii]|nr:hypothetical protein [Acinetobacter baumannii]